MVCSSDDRLALASTALELINGPRFTGSDHSELAKRSAWSGDMTWSEFGLQATSIPMTVQAAIVRRVMTIVPPDWNARAAHGYGLGVGGASWRGVDSASEAGGLDEGITYRHGHDPATCDDFDDSRLMRSGAWRR